MADVGRYQSGPGAAGRGDHGPGGLAGVIVVAGDGVAFGDPEGLAILRRQADLMRAVGATGVVVVGAAKPEGATRATGVDRFADTWQPDGRPVLVADGLWHWEIGDLALAAMAGSGSCLLVQPSDDPWAEPEHVVTDDAGFAAGTAPPGPPGTFANRVPAGIALIAPGSPLYGPIASDFASLELAAPAAKARCVPLGPTDYAIRAGTADGQAGARRRLAQIQAAAANRAYAASAPVTHVFLDRDGVLNEEGGHLTRVEDLAIVPGAPEAIAELNRRGASVSVVTNQSGLARGILTRDELAKIHAKIEDAVRSAGGSIARWDICPFHPDTRLAGGVQDLLRASDHRKPKPGMVFAAAEALGFGNDLAHTCFVGDTPNDLAAARLAGVRFVGIRSAKAASFGNESVRLYENLGAAVEAIVGGRGRVKRSAD